VAERPFDGALRPQLNLKAMATRRAPDVHVQQVQKPKLLQNPEMAQEMPPPGANQT
jgi:hypothetical protein